MHRLIELLKTEKFTINEVSEDQVFINVNDEFYINGDNNFIGSIDSDTDIDIKFSKEIEEIYSIVLENFFDDSMEDMRREAGKFYQNRDY